MNTNTDIQRPKRFLKITSDKIQDDNTIKTITQYYDTETKYTIDCRYEYKFWFSKDYKFKLDEIYNTCNFDCIEIVVSKSKYVKVIEKYQIVTKFIPEYYQCGFLSNDIIELEKDSINYTSCVFDHETEEYLSIDGNSIFSDYINWEIKSKNL
jgi:hypothetical protein